MNEQQELYKPTQTVPMLPRPRFRMVCKKVRVLEPRLGNRKRHDFGRHFGDVFFEELSDTDSIGASIGLSKDGANASASIGWGKVALIAIPIGYIIWTQVLKKKGLGLPVIG
jgi:hypothetical protein